MANCDDETGRAVTRFPATGELPRATVLLTLPSPLTLVLRAGTRKTG